MRILALAFVFAALLLAWPVSAIAQSDDVSAWPKQVERLYEQGNYGQAILIAKREAERVEKELGVDHLAYSRRLLWLGVLNRENGEFDIAQPLLEQTVEIQTKALGPESSEYATSVNELAVLYTEQGQYGKAGPLLEQAKILSTVS